MFPIIHFRSYEQKCPGWSLSGIPLITRVIRGGLPDDNYSITNPNNKGKGYIDIANTLGQIYQNTDFYTFLNIPNPSITDPLFYGDSEPDVYTCNLLSGTTFRFTLDANGKPVSIPRNNVLIDFDSETGIIEIIDEYGIKYLFDQFEFTPPSLSTDNFNTISTWYPSAISTFDDAFAINFTYQSDTLQYATKKSEQLTYRKSIANNGSFSIQGLYESRTNCGSNIANCVFGYPININRHHRKNITQISTSDNKFKVTFVNDLPRADAFINYTAATSSSPKTFSKIQIWDRNAVSEEIQFHRSYFEANNSMSFSLGSHIEAAAAKRLKLDSLTCIDQRTLKEKKYLLTYFDGNIPHIADPDHDYWGFFNNAGNSGQSVYDDNTPLNASDPLDYFATQSISTEVENFIFNNPNIDKNASLAGTRSTVLKSITYPTGGKTEFDYELNQFRSIEKTFSVANPIMMVANQCDASNCTCQSFPSNNTDIEIMAIEDFEEFFKSDITITANSNLTNQSQPTSCTTDPSFTLSIEKGGIVFKSISANVQVSTNVTAKLADLFNINLSDEIDFVTGDYVFRLTASNLEVTAAIDNYVVTANEIIHNGPGLRVKSIAKITNDASLSSSISYTYNDSNNTTSGYLFNAPKTSSYYQTFYDGNFYTLNMLGIQQSIASGGEREELTYYSDSYEPLSNFEKGFGFYTKVTEHHLNGASIVSEFERVGDTNPIRVTSGLPVYLPYNSSLLNKKTKRTALLDNNGITVQYDTLQNEVNHADLITGTRFHRWVVTNAYHNGNNFVNDVFFIKYPLVTSNIRLKSESMTLDGVSTNRSYKYRTDDAHLLPIEITTNHTDGSVEKAETKFAHDFNNTDLLTYNLVHLPLETKLYIDNVQTHGSKTNFSLFGGFPRPQTIQSYNWQTSQWETEMTILSYDTRGNPTSRQSRGWNTESFTWQHDLPLTRTFENFTWQYLYHPNSRLLQKYTEPNGLFTTFDYNGYLQLSEINQYNNKVITSRSYDHRLTDDSNKITTTINHLEGADFTTEQEFDGLGRAVLERKVGYGHNNQNLIIQTEYDNIGRLWKQYEPSFEGTTGAYTEYAYEESGLNRVATVTPPAPLGVSTITYGNENGELFVETTTNALGQTNQSFTDTRGRLLKSINGKLPELATTLYQYDDRNNVLKIIPHGRTETDADYIYSYIYDGRNNTLSTKIPEKTLMELRYNLRDLVTHTKDGIQPIVHTKYDNFGRIDQTGFVGSLTATTYTDLLTDNTYNTTVGSLGFGQIDQTQVALLDEAGSPSGQYIATDVVYRDNYHRPTYIQSNHPLNLGVSNSFGQEMYYNSLDQIKFDRYDVTIGSTTKSSVKEFTFDHSGRLEKAYIQLNIGGRRETCHITEYNK